MRINAKNRCLVFVLTCPVESDYKTQNENLARFFENLRKPHSWGFCHNYVWVREYQKNGRPHWHCVADIPRFPLRKVNDYWSGLWQSDSSCSLRLHQGANRFLADSNRLCWYLTKYFVKNFTSDFKPIEGTETKTPRKFGSSQELVEGAKPKISLASDHSERIKKQYDVLPLGHETFYLAPKEWRQKKDRKKTEFVQTEILEKS